MKEKVKEFWEKNKDDIKQEASRALWLVVGIGAGYCIGDRITLLKVENGINKCIIANPELETAIHEAMAAVEKKRNLKG